VILGALATSFVTQAASKGVNLIAAALKEGAEEDERPVGASRNIEISESAFKKSLCVHIARGHQYRHKPSGALAAIVGVGGWTDESAIPRTVGERLFAQSGIYLAGQPDFFFEGLLSASGNGDKMALTPLYAWLGEPIRTTTLNPSPYRHIAVALAIDNAGASSDLSSSPGTVVELGQMRRNEAVCFGAMPVFSVAPDDEAEELKKRRFGAERSQILCKDLAAKTTNQKTETELGLRVAEAATVSAAFPLSLATSDTGRAAASRATTQNTGAVSTVFQPPSGSIAPGDGNSAEPATANAPAVTPTASTRTTSTSGSDGAGDGGSTEDDGMIVLHQPSQSAWFAIPLTKNLEPKTLRVLVTEKRSASEILEFVASVFSQDVQTAIKTEVQNTLDPAARERIATERLAAEATTLDNLDATLINLDTKVIDAKNATSSCVTAASSSAAQDTRIKLFALNNAFRDAGRQEPISRDIITAIRVTDTDAGIQAACQTADVAVMAVTF